MITIGFTFLLKINLFKNMEIVRKLKKTSAVKIIINFMQFILYFEFNCFTHNYILIVIINIEVNLFHI